MACRPSAVVALIAVAGAAVLGSPTPAEADSRMLGDRHVVIDVGADVLLDSGVLRGALALTGQLGVGRQLSPHWWWFVRGGYGVAAPVDLTGGDARMSELRTGPALGRCGYTGCWMIGAEVGGTRLWHKSDDYFVGLWEEADWGVVGDLRVRGQLHLGEAGRAALALDFGPRGGWRNRHGWWLGGALGVSVVARF
jgi:hypothetical protein